MTAVAGMSEGSRNGRQSHKWQRVPGMPCGFRNGNGVNEERHGTGILQGSQECCGVPRNGIVSQQWQGRKNGKGFEEWQVVLGVAGGGVRRMIGILRVAEGPRFGRESQE